MDCEADFGTWEKGQTISFKAKTEAEAIRIAVSKKEALVKKGKLTDRDFVVQVGEKTASPGVRRIFYDYMNGHMKARG